MTATPMLGLPMGSAVGPEFMAQPAGGKRRNERVDSGYHAMGM